MSTSSKLEGQYFPGSSIEYLILISYNEVVSLGDAYAVGGVKWRTTAIYMIDSFGQQ